MRDIPEQDQPLIAADEELYQLLSSYAPPSIYLAIINSIKEEFDAADVLIAERLLLYSVAGETVLLPVLADLLRTTQERILKLIDQLEKAKLIQAELVYITKKGGVLAHILGTRKLVEMLVTCRDRMRKDRRRSIEQRLTKEELELMNEDRRLARQEQRWHLAGELKSEPGMQQQDSSKEAIHARARRFAEAERIVTENKRQAMQLQREELAKRVRVIGGRFRVYYANTKHVFDTLDQAVDALIENELRKKSG